jgi:hypothetical protein
MKIIQKILYAIGYHLGRGFINSNEDLKKILFNKNNFDLKSAIEHEQKEKSYKFFKNYFNNSIIIEGRLNNLSYSINKCLELIEKNQFTSVEYSFLEFGIYKGETTNHISKKIQQIDFKLDAFDSFQGLSEDRKFTNDPKGSYSTKNVIPTVNKNVNIIIGDIFETLGPFLNNSKNKIIFIHIDTDTYETTKFILHNIKPYLINGSIIVFDELHNFMGWEAGEAKALFEVFKKEEFEFLSFSSGQQATIRIK